MPNAALHLATSGTTGNVITNPYYREAMMLLDEVARFASIGEFFEAGCWWRDVLRPLEHVKEPDLKLAVQKRMGELSEQIVQAQRKVHLQAATGDYVQSVRKESAAAGAFGV